MNNTETNLADTVSSLDRDTARGRYARALQAVETTEAIVAWMRKRLNDAESLLRATHRNERRALLEWLEEEEEITRHPEIVGIVENARMMERLANE